MQHPKKGIFNTAFWPTCPPSLFPGSLFRTDSLEEGKANCLPRSCEPNLTVTMVGVTDVLMLLEPADCLQARFMN